MTDRRLHQCRYGSCDSEAKFTIAILIPFSPKIVTKESPFFRIESSIARCERHINLALENVLSDTNQNLIKDAAKSQGYPTPNFEQAQIVVVPIGENPLPRC